MTSRNFRPPHDSDSVGEVKENYSNGEQCVHYYYYYYYYHYYYYYRGLKLKGKQDELLKRVSNCVKSGNHHTLNPSINNGKWFATKIWQQLRQKC